MKNTPLHRLASYSYQVAHIRVQLGMTAMRKQCPQVFENTGFARVCKNFCASRLIPIKRNLVSGMLKGTVVVMLLSAMAVADGSCSDNILKSTTLNRQVPWTNARANAGQWYFGIYGNSPEFSGHYLDQGSEKTNFDLNNSLYMDTEKTGYGLHMEYSGSRFAFSVDYGIQDYTGNNRLERQVEINNIIFVPGMDVTSSLKNTAFDINGTIKLLRGAQAWLGVDVGIQAWYMDLVASGVHTFLPIAPAEANKSIVVSIPQIGISGNFQGLQNRLVINGRAHFMALKGASSNRFSADARYFFLHWLGGRVFWEQQNHDEPYDSMHKNIEQKYERKGIGFGVVARW